jgi:mono/diheme cytochrome c family protein
VINALKNGKDLMQPYPALTDAQIEAIARYVERASRMNWVRAAERFETPSPSGRGLG